MCNRCGRDSTLTSTQLKLSHAHSDCTRHSQSQFPRPRPRTSISPPITPLARDQRSQPKRPTITSQRGEYCAVTVRIILQLCDFSAKQPPLSAVDCLSLTSLRTKPNHKCDAISGVQFLPRDAAFVPSGSRNSVRPTVCPSVTLVVSNWYVSNPKNLRAIFLYHMKGLSL